MAACYTTNQLNVESECMHTSTKYSHTTWPTSDRGSFLTTSPRASSCSLLRRRFAAPLRYFRFAITFDNTPTISMSIHNHSPSPLHLCDIIAPWYATCITTRMATPLRCLAARRPKKPPPELAPAAPSPCYAPPPPSPTLPPRKSLLQQKRREEKHK